MYQSLELSTQQKQQQKASDSSNAVQRMFIDSQQGSNETSASTMRAREEKKSAFWDCLDPQMWVEDSKVSSCMRCQHDFTLRRRRHHCRKCGKIFCKDCNKKRTIEGLNNRICITCENAYDTYTKSIAGMMRMTQAYQREFEREQNLEER